MTTNALQAHYEKKYAKEEAMPELAPITIVSQPTNRFEAAVKFIPQFFRGGSILELGAGNGAVAKTLLNLDIGIENYILGDISLPRVKGMAAAIQDDRAIARYLDADQPPEEEHARYDAVIMIALIEHLIDPLRAMQNIHSLLKPHGIAYIDTPNIAKYTRRAQLILGRFPSTASKNEGLTTYEGNPTDLYDEGHLHYFTYRSLSHMLVHRCGFSRVEKRSYPCGKLFFGKRVESSLAHLWPEAFSELVVVAHH